VLSVCLGLSYPAMPLLGLVSWLTDQVPALPRVSSQIWHVVPDGSHLDQTTTDPSG
jgi:hypothetical protein